MSLQDEYVQVDNTTDIEYGIYFTLNQLLFLNTYENIYENNIFKKIDDAIDNIYHNKQLNKLIESEERFKDVIDDIDEKLDMMKESMYYDSPFFNGFKKNGLIVMILVPAPDNAVNIQNMDVIGIVLIMVGIVIVMVLNFK